MKYAIYNTATGAIARVISCPAVDLNRQLQSGEAYLEVDGGDDASHYVEAGAMVAKVLRPSDDHVFDYDTKTWIDPRTLQQLKAAKWAGIKVARNKEIVSPLVTNYGVFDADEKAANNITKAVVLAQTLASVGQPVAIGYTLANNTVVTLGLSEMVTVGLTLAGREQSVRNKATGLRALIESASTESALAGVTW